MSKVPTGPCFITSTQYPKAVTALRGEVVVASEGIKNAFNLVAADEGLYKIQFPYVNEAWTLNSIGSEQVHVEYFDGLSSQQFRIEPVEGKSDTFYIYVDTDNGPAFLGFAPYTIPTWPPIYFIVGYAEDDKAKAEQWVIKNAPSDD